MREKGESKRAAQYHAFLFNESSIRTQYEDFIVFFVVLVKKENTSENMPNVVVLVQIWRCNI